MTPERWRQAERVFHAALEHAQLQSEQSTSREQWLKQACGDDAELLAEVKSLLDAQPNLAHSIEHAVLDLHEDSSIAGRRIGQYRLIRELGRGGMGAVYLAARDDEQYQLEVAIKLVRPGLDTDFILRRFRRERQILARMQHPHIARLLDGGSSDSLPYLVMEYVPGDWITRYAVKHRLSVEQRLRLFLPVCDAVDYAHRSFIVHRDLKPGNILVDESGSPKLLDFGISKLVHRDGTEQDTRETSAMTPDYASPEQITGDPVTAASDVYSLGAVLYELLSGCRPHRIESFAPLALERAICHEPVAAPSAATADRMLARALAGDLDNIILRAMQKTPSRRYASAVQFADDIQRFLDHRPVSARPDSLAYRAKKFVRRNRVSVVLAFLVLDAVFAGAAATALHARMIAREEIARAARADAAAGDAYRKLGDLEQARAWYRRAIKEWRTLDSSADRQEAAAVASSLQSLETP